MATNYQFNPNFATNTTGWAVTGTATIARVVDGDFVPGTALEIVATTVNHGTQGSLTDAISIPGLGIYTFNIAVKLTAGTSDRWYISPDAVSAANANLGAEAIAPTSFTPTGAVTNVSFAITVDNASADAVRIKVWKLDNTGAATLRVSSLELLAPETGNPHARIRSQFELRPAY